jgi:hypothetical protein
MIWVTSLKREREREKDSARGIEEKCKIEKRDIATERKKRYEAKLPWFMRVFAHGALRSAASCRITFIYFQRAFEEASSSSSSSSSSSGSCRVRAAALSALCVPWDGAGARGAAFAPSLALGPPELISALAAAAGGATAAEGAAAAEGASRAQRLEAWVARDGSAGDGRAEDLSRGECSAEDVGAACAAACEKALRGLAGRDFLLAS